MVLGAAPFWVFSTLFAYFYSCSGFDLLMVQALQFIL